jgi:hypothetical protein
LPSSTRSKRELDRQRERAERYAQQLTVLNRILRHDVRTGVQVRVPSLAVAVLGGWVETLQVRLVSAGSVARAS